jgi:hypothetical protein
MLLERFNLRKRTVRGRWHIDKTYIKLRGQWMYLSRAIDSVVIDGRQTNRKAIISLNGSVMIAFNPAPTPKEQFEAIAA